MVALEGKLGTKVRRALEGNHGKETKEMGLEEMWEKGGKELSPPNDYLTRNGRSDLRRSRGTAETAER